MVLRDWTENRDKTVLAWMKSQTRAMEARIYYKAFFSNDVASDHKRKFRGKQYSPFSYEDIELRFFTDIGLPMDNKDWEWIQDNNGRWKKQINA
jgi:hypothetical protein